MGHLVGGGFTRGAALLEGLPLGAVGVGRGAGECWSRTARVGEGERGGGGAGWAGEHCGHGRHFCWWLEGERERKKEALRERERERL